jgi:hypothetical protein
MQKLKCENLNCKPIRVETFVGNLIYNFKCSVCDRLMWIPISIYLHENCPVPPYKKDLDKKDIISL